MNRSLLVSVFTNLAKLKREAAISNSKIGDYKLNPVEKGALESLHRSSKLYDKGVLESLYRDRDDADKKILYLLRDECQAAMADRDRLVKRNTLIEEQLVELEDYIQFLEKAASARVVGVFI